MAASSVAPCTLPVVYLGLSGIAFCASLHSKSQRQRLAILPFIIIFAWFSLSSTRHVWFAHGVAVVWGQVLMGYVLHAISILHVENIPPPPPDASTHSMKWIQQSTGIDLVYFRRFWLNPRLIRVPGSKQAAGGYEREESRAAFLMLQVARLLIYWVVQTKVAPSLFREAIGEIFPEEVSPYQQSLLRPLDGFTTRECFIVAFVTFSSIWTTVMYLDGSNAFLAFCGVLGGIDDPDDWPRLFGSPASAVGLRAFWAKFWQALPKKPYQSIGRCIARWVFDDPECESIASKTAIALVAFGTSGVTHAFIDWQRGQKDWDLVIWWFALNFVGCTFETMLARSLPCVAGKFGVGRLMDSLRRSWLGRFAGYAWVCLFFCWITPMWRFPAIHQQTMAHERMRLLLSKMSIV